MSDLLVYVLFQTDVCETVSSRVFFGVFDSKEAAIDAAKRNDLYSCDVCVVVIQTTLNEFGEV